MTPHHGCARPAFGRPVLVHPALDTDFIPRALAKLSPVPEPPAAPFRAVSGLTGLPDFLPGLGTLYVDPATFPYGPFLACDRQGVLVGTIHMIPLSDADGPGKITALMSPGSSVTGIDLHYNAGRPDIQEPHCHVVLWHRADGRQRVAG